MAETGHMLGWFERRFDFQTADSHGVTHNVLNPIDIKPAPLFSSSCDRVYALTAGETSIAIPGGILHARPGYVIRIAKGTPHSITCISLVATQMIVITPPSETNESLTPFTEETPLNGTTICYNLPQPKLSADGTTEFNYTIPELNMSLTYELIPMCAVASRQTHHHNSSMERRFVVDGRCTLTHGDYETELQLGQLVVIPIGEPHALVNNNQQHAAVLTWHCPALAPADTLCLWR